MLLLWQDKCCFLDSGLSDSNVEGKAHTWMVSRWWRCRNNHSSGTSLFSDETEYRETYGLCSLYKTRNKKEREVTPMSTHPFIHRRPHIQRQPPCFSFHHGCPQLQHKIKHNQYNISFSWKKFSTIEIKDTRFFFSFWPSAWHLPFPLCLPTPPLTNQRCCSWVLAWVSSLLYTVYTHLQTYLKIHISKLLLIVTRNNLSVPEVVSQGARECSRCLWQGRHIHGHPAERKLKTNFINWMQWICPYFGFKALYIMDAYLVSWS